MATTADPTEHTLDLPGTRLCYETSGTGPLLLLVGAPMGSRGFATITPLLAQHFTVVTYDPRGILRSTVEGPDAEVTLDLLTDDVHHLLAALGSEPAYVFGSSGGASIGLALLARYPEQVRALVAHEAPLVELLPDSEQLSSSLEEVCQTYADDGRNEALKKYAALTGVERFSRPPGGGRHEVTDLESFTPPADVRAILDRFFLHILRPTALYRPDLSALRAVSARIVVAGGTTSKGQLSHRSSTALAGELGTALVDFPGDHTGFQGEPEPFVSLLRQVLMETA
ncbi:alpha/beta fold hydrolase [Streptomyces sp. ISL-100]|uniref:alpha/beta fold hydrolase n=1 Tax=Streptomyces sp. ISL-100 TaxID=2819173 RepID=UPI001BE763C7|nr:alpha/beta hydrolase [Streptomyces sp. ISL-100]MBT2399842.1 alpha/beta hydrolase [Streptomyces sp. ISL-100]